MRSRASAIAVLALLSAGLAYPAHASFHFMQIEQVSGGQCGHTRSQAVQLRMRAGGQNQVSGKKLVVLDASGSNPITVFTFPSNVTTSTLGSRILIVTSSAAPLLPNADFVTSVMIPASYLAAGRLAFEDEGNIIYWSVSWGGAGYTGSNTGSTTNDADGNFGPAFASALPSATTQALLFGGAASALSTNNAADYAVTGGAAAFTSNDNEAVLFPECVFFDGFEGGNTSAWSLTFP
jgi:hypothetical protein